MGKEPLAAAKKSEEFEIKVHDAERIVEVLYPSHPTRASLARYGTQVKAAILKLGAPWRCLVDQRDLSLLPPDLSDQIAELNAWARENGMARSVRLVKDSAVAELQARRILKEGGVDKPGSLFRSREAAWAALTGE